MQRKTKAQKKRDTMTAKQRKSTLFRYRIVITMPPWGVLVMAGSAGFVFLTRPLFVTNVISIVLVVVGLILVIRSRAMVKALRHDVHEALNDIGNDELVLGSDYPADEQTETIRLKRINNTNGSSRVSG